MTAVIAVFSDTHINSTIGLYAPGSGLDDGATIQSSKSQSWLWESVWLPYWKEVAETAKKTRATKVYAVSLGDLVDINTHSHAQLFTENQAVIVAGALDALAPSAKIVDEYIFLRGTEAHCGRSCFLEELVAAMYAKSGHAVLKDEATGAYSHWFLEISFDGVNCVFAHHPGTNSTRPWTQGGGAIRKAAWLTYDYYGQPWQPQIGVFGHVHHNEDSADSHPVRVVFSRPMSFFTAFDHRLGHTAQNPKVGGIIMVAKEGSLWLKKVQHELPKKAPIAR